MTWYRVNDRAHPLWGLEVCGDIDNQDPVSDRCDEPLLEVLAVRRFDVIMNGMLQIPRVRGMYLSFDILELAPVQDDLIEFEVGPPPHGKCLEEKSIVVDDRHVLDVALYERAVQVALKKRTHVTDGLVLASETFVGKYVMSQVELAARGRTFDQLRDDLIDGSFFGQKGGD